MNTLTHSLGLFATQPIDHPEKEVALEIAKTGFIDTVATMFAGSSEPVVNILVNHYGQFASSLKEAPVPFSGALMSSQFAACISGTSAHALDFDDVALSGHPSTVLVPAILAEGHLCGVSGREALEAYLVGYEVWAHLIAKEPDQYHIKGWHPTGVMGTVGAAAAIARIRKLDPQTACTALSIAASMASGLVANFGSMTKPLHAGRAAANAIEAVRLAQAGLTASSDIFEHPAGFLYALSPNNLVNLSSSAEPIGKNLHIVGAGLCIKQYPVCYSGHRSIDAILDLMKKHDVKLDEIKKITATIGKAQASMLRNHTPQTGLEAKFSLEFAIACALLEQRVGLNELTDEFVQRPQVQAIFSKVKIEITDLSCPIEPAFSYSDRVVIELVNNKLLDSGEIRFAKGNSKNPLTMDELKTKFMECLKVFQTNAKGSQINADLLFSKLNNLNSLKSLGSLWTN